MADPPAACRRPRCRAPHEPFLILPGFMPDAVGYAVRTTTALLLAYLVAFAIQLDTASSAGLCVAIVAQPSPGMAVSKAAYRTLGTVLGGAVALLLVAAFPQDRTMLLVGFTAWLGACTFVAALLRDFRSYGAVLCGYTVGIIAVSGIDAPDGALLATLNRVAAILLGIAAVALVNTRSPGRRRSSGWSSELPGGWRDAGAGLAALAGQAPPGEPAGRPGRRRHPGAAHRGQLRRRGAARWPPRRAGATAAIAGLLGMLSASRAIATGCGPARRGNPRSPGRGRRRA